MVLFKSFTETSTLLSKSTTAVGGKRPSWATIVTRGRQYLYPPPPSDVLVLENLAKFHEVTEVTQDLSHPKDEIKSQLVSSASKSDTLYLIN